ncbi:MAG: hypothetical protein IPK33_25685 [Gemmatimonadetes bacterium]|nr:hypothetical protein [Gemmatimonadota bacterium]
MLRLPTYGAERAFLPCWIATSFLRASSWQLAWYDRDLREDLEQEGRIALWRLNPVRLTAVVNPDGYRRAVIRYAMLRHLRTLSRQDPADKRIDWRIVEEVLETFGERRAVGGGGVDAAAALSVQGEDHGVHGVVHGVGVIETWGSMALALWSPHP